MLKTYDEIYAENGFGISKERSQWEIARELSRRNDLLEVEMLCKTAEALRAAAKSSERGLYETGWEMAEDLTLLAHKKITDICRKEVNHETEVE
jgi:hypothetical protein